MPSRVCVVGYGRVGSLTAEFVSKHYDITVYDTSDRAVERARRRGFEAHLSDTTSNTVVSKIASHCDVVATALPSNRALDVIKLLIDSGVNAIVDVSYIPDPTVLRRPAIDRRVKVFVDVGIAPGLSNILLAYGYRLMERTESAIIYVGGIAEEDDGVLGLVASWNMEDLLEEYVRPARARIAGRLRELNPINDAIRVRLEGLGEFDALPTDGLRTLLESFSNIPTMIEYTLRYPGHLERLRLLDKLGLLEGGYRSVHGQAVQPRSLLARLLEEKLPREKDRVILYVEVKGLSSKGRMVSTFLLDERQSKLKTKTPVLSYVTALIHSWFVLRAVEGYGHIGLNTPEETGLNADETKKLFEYLASHGIRVKTRQCIEEY
ncbi:MAG: saccharopine dehydrogenase C-terminal domain-containing protein [Pyrodictiaceae archaeon]